jgi:hypothetical protein
MHKSDGIRDSGPDSAGESGIRELDRKRYLIIPAPAEHTRQMQGTCALLSFSLQLQVKPIREEEGDQIGSRRITGCITSEPKETNSTPTDSILQTFFPLCDNDHVQVR